jgi:hypothetical protein
VPHATERAQKRDESVSAVTTVEEAAAWVDRVGIALVFPKDDVVLPSLWVAAGGTDAYAERDADARRRLDDADDELDDLHVSLTSEVSSGKVSTPVAIELALVGRFYERLGDHAVNITAHVRYMATGGR